MTEIIDWLIRNWEKPIQRAQYLGSGVRVGANQFPEIHEVISAQASALDIATPEVFIKQDPTLNAFTFGTNDDACIVIHSALFNLLEESELEFFLAHEMGHIKARHITYLSVLSAITHGVLGFVGYVPMLSSALCAWSRASETTADRVGFLILKDPTAAVRALLLLAVGNRELLSRMRIGPYLAQHSMPDDFYGKFELYFGNNDHPHTVSRVKDILEFAREPAAIRARDIIHRSNAQPGSRRIGLKALAVKGEQTSRFCTRCGFEMASQDTRNCSFCGGKSECA